MGATHARAMRSQAPVLADFDNLSAPGAPEFAIAGRARFQALGGRKPLHVSFASDAPRSSLDPPA